MKKNKMTFGEQLIESVREAVDIHRGLRAPSRVFEFSSVSSRGS